MAVSPREHVIDPSITHHRWLRSLPPALEIESGDVVHYDLAMAAAGEVSRTSTGADVKFDWETMYILSGPVYVKGAEPGDTLQIDILKLEPGAWGWTAILPDLGLLPDDFPDPHLRIFDLTDGRFAHVAPSVRVPFAPFLGTMGVHPDEPDDVLPFPPHRGGGNLDTRHLGVGATLWLPVWCDGARFSCGDPHAMQGDGEVCVSALECPMKGTLRLTLHKRSIPGLQFSLPPNALPSDPRGHHATMGLGEDLMDCARSAARGMIAWLVAEHGLSREDAYILCSLAGDLKIHELVDAGTWNVGMTMPLSVFVD